MSNYHKAVLAGYGALMVIIAINAPDKLNYQLKNPLLFILLYLFTGLAFFIANKVYFRKNIALNKRSTRQFFGLMVYGFAFAVPEEILFRGIIQSELSSLLKRSGWAILFSSLIFGIAHLWNGSKGLVISKWNWRLATLSFFGGLPLGLSYLITQGLLGPTLLHLSYLIILQAIN